MRRVTFDRCRGIGDRDGAVQRLGERTRCSLIDHHSAGNGVEENINLGLRASLAARASSESMSKTVALSLL